MTFLRRTLPLLICFVTGIVFLVQYYVPMHESNEALRHGGNTIKVLIGFSYIIGLYSLVHLHWSRIRRGNPGWGYSLLVFVGLAPMLFFGFVGELERGLEAVFKRDFAFAHWFQTYDQDGTGSVYGWFYLWVFVPAQAAMFSLLAFFIASAFLLVAALLVLFGRVPLANLASGTWVDFPGISDWIMAVPNLAAKRGILIGVSLGIIGTALRVIFGIERAYIGGD